MTATAAEPADCAAAARAATALALSLALTACATPRPTLDDADYPGLLQAPEALGVEVVWQQRVTAAWREGPDGALRERGFDAAVQRRDDTLTVLGLSPMGSVGFSIVQGPDGIRVEQRGDERLGVPPRFVLLDVQRTFFPWLGEAAADGERAGRVADEEVRERWRDGRLVERTFARVDGEPAGEIAITYEWGRADWAAPTRAVLDNGWFGYRLTIDTHAETRLAPAAGAPQ